MNSNHALMDRLWIRLVILLAVFAVVGVAAVGVVSANNWVDLKWVWIALGTCVISSLVAHVAGEYPSGHEKFMARLGRSMLARTSLPFFVVISAQIASPGALETGFVLLVILFYLVGLVADIYLQVLRMKTAN